MKNCSKMTLSSILHRGTALLVSAAFVTLLAVGARGESGETVDEVPDGLTPAALDRMQALPGELAPLPALPPWASGSPFAEKVRLGRNLFFDKRLSNDMSMSCATCHDPLLGFSDGRKTSNGASGKPLRRHSPTLLNAIFNTLQFWDGRASTLAQQATMPIMDKGEMNMLSEENLVVRLKSVESYRKLFDVVYGGDPTLQRVGDAIAAFEATLITPGAPFDRYASGEKAALTAEEKRGLALFIGKAACTQCHLGPNLTDNKFHNLGVAFGPTGDMGRFEVTKSDADRHAFRTQGLRNIAITAPYMHDGSLATLEEVVDFYNRGGGEGPKSELIFPLELTEVEKRELVAFLKTLTGDLPKTDTLVLMP